MHFTPSLYLIPHTHSRYLSHPHIHTYYLSTYIRPTTSLMISYSFIDSIDPRQELNSEGIHNFFSRACRFLTSMYPPSHMSIHLESPSKIVRIITFKPHHQPPLTPSPPLPSSSPSPFPKIANPILQPTNQPPLS